MDTKKREAWIDGAKCIAIVIVLMNHSGLIIPGVNFVGGMFFVPIFFVLAGYTYVQKDEYLWDFVKKKAKRLLLPYFAANLFLFLFFFIKDSVLKGAITEQSFMPLFGVFYSRNQLFAEWGYSLYPLLNVDGYENVYFLNILNSPLWFLTALFLTLVVFEMVCRFTKGDIRKMSLFGSIFLICGILYHYLMPVLLPWSIDSIGYFYLFCLAGYWIRQHNIMDKLGKKPIIIVVLAAIFAVSAYVNGSANFSVGDTGRSVILALCNACISSLLLLILCKKTEKYLPGIVTGTGRYTLSILSWHLFVFMFGTTAINMLLSAVKAEGIAALEILLKAVMIVVTMWVISFCASRIEKFTH